MAFRIRQGFNLGGAVAESDPLLQEAFYDNGDYTAIASREDPRRFVIGRTGSGKSANFERLEDLERSHVTRIAPENLSLTYIANLDIVRQLTSIGVRLDIFFSALWKHVIIVELLRHRYPMSDATAKETILDSLRETFKRDPVRRRAVDYLDSFGDKFWSPADERVRQIAEGFEQAIRAGGEVAAQIPLHLSASASTEAEAKVYSELRREEAAKYQKIVNEIQLPKLNEMVKILSETIINSDQWFTYLVIDDLDREWADDDTERLLIRCLFQAVVELQRVRYLKVLVALRSNIFHQLNFGPGGGEQQGEKFRNLALNLKWTRNDLKLLLDHRVRAACRRQGGPAVKSIEEMLPTGRHEGQTALQYILDRTLLRPRDAIVFLNICLREAIGKEKISWDVIQTAEKEYSLDRLFALRDEWSDPYPGLQEVFEIFRRIPTTIDRAEMTRRLDEVVLLMTHPKFEGTVWVTECCSHFWQSTEQASWYEAYGSLVQLLYNIGFVGCATSGEGTVHYAHSDPLYASESAKFEEGMRFCVHPAFRLALEVA